MGNLKHTCTALSLCIFIVGSVGATKSSLCDKNGEGDLVDESIYIWDTYRRGANIDFSNCPDEDKALTTHLLGERSCKKNMQNTSCPTYLALNFDPDRKPSMIVEVKCACEQCQARTGTMTYRCQPLYYYRNVRLKDENGQEKMKVRRFKVGCECRGNDSEEANQLKKN